MHKYLKKYGGFRSRALPCPLADIYCRARFKNAFRAQKGTTVNGRARARERERAEEFVPICLKALCSCQWVEAASERMHARNERSTLFSCARITICSIRSRQSLKLFDARGLSISLLRPRTVHAALSTAFRVLIMNIVFYDPAFSFVSRFFLFFSLSLPLFFFPLVRRLRLSRHGRESWACFFRGRFNDRRWSTSANRFDPRANFRYLFVRQGLSAGSLFRFRANRKIEAS